MVNLSKASAGDTTRFYITPIPRILNYTNRMKGQTNNPTAFVIVCAGVGWARISTSIMGNSYAGTNSIQKLIDSSKICSTVG